MGKAVPDAELDLIADDLIAHGNKEVLCSAQPTTYLEANETYMLANVVLASGDYTKGDGSPDGRKVTIAAKPGVSRSNSGTATHVAIIDTTNSLLKVITICNSYVVPDPVDIPEWTVTLRDPT